MPGTKQVNVGSLKVGQYVMIDGVPCEIVDISVSKQENTEELRQEL